MTNEKMKVFFEHFELSERLDWKFNFACFSDSVFTYSLQPSETEFLEISFIADDTLLSEMTAKELIELKRISFFQHRIFYRSSEGEDWDCFDCVTYVKENIANLN